MATATGCTQIGAVCYASLKKMGEVMKEWLSEWYNKYAVLVISAVIGYGLYSWIAWCKIDGQTWAAWVQAIGSIGAILVAVWVMKHQIRTAEEQTRTDRRDAERRLLVSIRTEVLLLFDGFNQTTRHVFANASKGAIFNSIYRLPEAPFTVYESVVGNIGIIENDLLRRTVIETYAKFKGMMILISMNNETLGQLETLLAAVAGTDVAGFVEVEERRLVELGDQLVDRYQEVLECVKCLEKEIP